MGIPGHVCFVLAATSQTSGDHARFELRHRAENLPDECSDWVVGIVGRDLAGVDREHSAARAPDLLQARLLESETAGEAIE